MKMKVQRSRIGDTGLRLLRVIYGCAMRGRAKGGVATKRGGWTGQRGEGRQGGVTHMYTAYDTCTSSDNVGKVFIPAHLPEHVDSSSELTMIE